MFLDIEDILKFWFTISLVALFGVAVWVVVFEDGSSNPNHPRACVAAVMNAIDAQAELERATFRVSLECRGDRPTEPATITQ